MSGENGVSSHDKIQKLVSWALREARNAGETDPSDTFGTKQLMFLIGALKIIGASVIEWDRIAAFPLERSKGPLSYYRQVLAELVPHTSLDMVERIQKHFIDNGELDALESLLRLRVWRKITSSEALEIAAYHCKARTSSDAPVWKELLRLVVVEDEKLLRNMLEEVRVEEMSDDIPF